VEVVIKFPLIVTLLSHIMQYNATSRQISW